MLQKLGWVGITWRRRYKNGWWLNYVAEVNESLVGLANDEMNVD